LVGRRRALALLVAAAISSLAVRRARASPMARAMTDPLVPRRRDCILFVVIDRPADAILRDHASNAHGLSRAVAEFDLRTRVVPVTIDELVTMDADAIDAAYAPLAIIGAGSFSEWFHYASDADWRKKLDHWMQVIRETTIPMLAICGSHQLVAAAFNGFGAVAHMHDEGDPVRISLEHAASTPRGMWPSPRVGEEGTYPLVPTTSGAVDPIVRDMGHAPMASAHHKDMVVDTTGFTLLYEGDTSRSPATDAPDQARTRCRVQAMRRDDPKRILYTSQFHPEMCAFDESTTSDRGFGAEWVCAFLRLARAWWTEQEGITTRSRRGPSNDEL
jgi:GMP synthase-like glutamine amidotransferase